MISVKLYTGGGGEPDDMESFIQETGRAGRDGKVSCSLLFFGKRELNKSRTSEQLITYCKNEDNQCCRKIIFADFDNCEKCTTSSSVSKCMCCYICKRSCGWGQCHLKVTISFFNYLMCEQDIKICYIRI